MAAAANDPGAASGVLAPPSCGVPLGTPRQSSLRLPLSLPGSFASLATITPTDSWSAPMADKARRTAFVCQQCGHAAPRWLGQCPGCGAWSTLVEEALPDARARGARAGAPGGEPPRPLAAVTAGAALRRPTGLAELDRVLGGGLVAGSVVLVGGDPGIGKSTLALQACGALAGQGLPVLYVAGEESPEQVRLRADRLGMAGAGVLVVAETAAERVAELIGETRP